MGVLFDLLRIPCLELIGKGEVLGIDIEIRDHNRIEIERHSNEESYFNDPGILN